MSSSIKLASSYFTPQMVVMVAIIYLKLQAYIIISFPFFFKLRMALRSQLRVTTRHVQGEGILHTVHTHLSFRVYLWEFISTNPLPSLIFKVWWPSWSPKDPCRVAGTKGEWTPGPRGQTKTQHPQVVICTVVNNLKHCFYVKASKQKGKPQKHCVPTLPRHQGLSPRASTLRVLGGLEKPSLLSIRKSREQNNLLQRLESDSPQIPPEVQLKCGNQFFSLKFFLSFKEISRKLQPYQNCGTQHCKTTRWPEFSRMDSN